MIISMFDKSLLQKGLCHFAVNAGDKEEPHLRVRNRRLQVSCYIHKDDAWIYNEPNKAADELVRLERFFSRLREISMLNRNGVFHPALPDYSDDIAWRVALYQFRVATVLGFDLSNQNLHGLREYICDGPNGVDDLLDMKPFEKKKQVVGEYEAHVDGQKITGDMEV